MSKLQELILEESIVKKTDKQGREQNSVDSYSLKILNKAENMNICFNRLYPAVQTGYEHQTVLKQIKDFKKKAFLDAIVKRFSHNQSLFEPALSNEIKRLKKLIASLRIQGYHADVVQIKAESRIIVGLGEQTPYETGIKLHHIYGYPIIPSTALKGVTRAWLEQAEDFGGIEDLELSSKVYNEAHKVFGSASKDEKWKKKIDIKAAGLEHVADSKLGDVMFFDAFPTSSPKMEVEIMNPHFSEYYSNPDQYPPGDWYSPKPIFFVTVASGTQFYTALASRNLQSFKKAREWLMNGLSELGIGSKTSSGYGYFDPNDLEEIKRQQQKEADEAELRHIQELKDKAAELAKNVRSPKEIFNEKLEKGTKEQLGDLIYKSWKALESDAEKIEGAKAILAKFAKVLKKKKDKPFVKDLQEWANKT